MTDKTQPERQPVADALPPLPASQAFSLTRSVYTADDMHAYASAALASRDAELAKLRQGEPVALPNCTVADVGFRWDGDKQEHIPQVLVSFTPVPANRPNDDKGWKDRDAFAGMLASPPPAQPPTEWTDAKLRGIASDYFTDSKDWPAAMLCLRHLLMEQGAAQPPQAEFHNPWRTSLENCISGDNYLRASEYRDLIEELDELYRLRAAQPPREPVQPLSEGKIFLLTGHCGVSQGMAISIARTIEAAHGITERMSTGGTK